MESTTPKDWYTWSEFTARVTALMPTDAQRLGLQDEAGVDGFITRTIRLAVIDLQRYVSAYRKNHETIYYPQDFVTDGSCSRAVMPPNANLKEFWLINSADENARYPVIAFPYSRRYELIQNMVQLPDQQGRIAIDETGYTFYIYPAVTDGWVLSARWDGMGTGNVKLDFKSDEQVPFEEDAAEAVADYVKSKIAREVDRDLPMSKDYMSTYLIKRKDLYLRHKDKSTL